MGKINIKDKILIENLWKQKTLAERNCWKNSRLKAGLGVDLIAC